MYKNILNTNKKNIPLKNSQELYDYVYKDSEDYIESFLYYKNKIINQFSEEDFIQNKGGIIILPSPEKNIDINGSQFTDYLNIMYDKIVDYLFEQKNINNILSKKDLILGCSVGNFFNGRYHARNGQLYSNNSVTLEITNLSFEQLVMIAEYLIKELKQKSILVKDYNSFTMNYIEEKDIKTKQQMNK